MHTELATVTSKYGKSIMHGIVSCLIIHFRCSKCGFQTNSGCEKKLRNTSSTTKIKSHFSPMKFFSGTSLKQISPNFQN
jgi:hypothetical protein